MRKKSLTKQIYLIRHGQTEYNRKKIVQGSGIDASLNNIGITQAEAFYKRYKKTNFDKIYTSKLKRAVQTVENFVKLGIAHEKLEGLNEISWGIHEGVTITAESNTHYQNIVNHWQQGKTQLAIEGGESPEQVYLRQKKAFQHILKQQQEQKVLICMHGRAMRILLCWLLGYDDLKYMDKFEHQNLSLYQLFYTGNQFQLRIYNKKKH